MQRRGVRLNGAGEAPLVGPPLLDVADEPRQDQVAVVVDDLGRRRGHRVLGPAGGYGWRQRAERLPQAPRDGRGVDGDARWQHLVGQAQEELLPVGQVRLRDVDAPVRHDAARHLDGPRPLGAPGQQLAADRVAHVVRQQGQAFHAERGDEGGDDVGLQRHGVGPVRLRRQPVAEHVEQQDAPPGPQAVEHGGVVERRRREPVQHEQGIVALGPDGRRVNGEDALAAQVAVRADGLPPGARGDGHVPASRCTTGPSVSQASDSIDQ